MNLLVLAPEKLDAGRLEAAVGEPVRDAKILVVSPALQSSPLAFWMSDSDGAITDAQETAAETEAALGQAGLEATAVTGESEPLLALQDALATFEADRIVVFVHDETEQQYREDDVIGEAERRFGVPVTQARI